MKIENALKFLDVSFVLIMTDPGKVLYISSRAWAVDTKHMLFGQCF